MSEFITTGLDHNIQNKAIYDAVMNSISSQYPVKGRNRSLVLSGLVVDDAKLASNDFPKQKETKLIAFLVIRNPFDHLLLRRTLAVLSINTAARTCGRKTSKNNSAGYFRNRL